MVGSTVTGVLIVVGFFLELALIHIFTVKLGIKCTHVAKRLLFVLTITTGYFWIASSNYGPPYRFMWFMYADWYLYAMIGMTSVLLLLTAIPRLRIKHYHLIGLYLILGAYAYIGAKYFPELLRVVGYEPQHAHANQEELLHLFVSPLIGILGTILLMWQLRVSKFTKAAQV